MRFRDRSDGGRLLAERLRHHAAYAPVVLGLPRGGLPVAEEVARALGAPLDVLVVRKIGVPWMPELAVGAVAEGGATFLDRDLAMGVGLHAAELEALKEEKRREVEERVRRFRGGPLLELDGRVVILVDDGIATGATARAAVRSVKRENPARLVLAAPVVARETAELLAPEVDELVAVYTPEDFVAVGVWYDRFPQVTDDEVAAILARRRAELEQAAESRP